MKSQRSSNFNRDTKKKSFKKKTNSFSQTKKVGKGKKRPEKVENEDGSVRLNKYIANAGICSRREADTLIGSGAVEVNGKIITELGTRIKPGDVVNVGGEIIKSERKQYLLLNKPKDYITTMDDPKGRKTVMDLVGRACKERIYPVGRLDRATTGLLLFTNDGEMTKKLTHPSSNIRKIYQVSLDKKVTQKDLFRLVEGIELDDGIVSADKVMYAQNGQDKSVVVLELHSGRYRVIRRMMEHLGYKVLRLDRTQFAGLTKKNIPRGRHRFLTEKEIGFLHRIAGIKQETKQ